MAHLERGERLFKYIDRGSKKVRQVLGYYRDFADRHLLERVEDLLGQDLVRQSSTDKIGRFVNRVTWVGFTPKPEGYELPEDAGEQDENPADHPKNWQPLLTFGASVEREAAAKQDEFRIELRIGSHDKGFPYRQALRDVISDDELREELIVSLGDEWNLQVLHQAATRTPVTDEEEMEKFQRFLGAEKASRLDEFINLFGDEDAQEQIRRVRRRIRKNTISIKEYEDRIGELKREHLGEYGTHDVCLLRTMERQEYLERFHPESLDDEEFEDKEPEQLDDWILERFEELVEVWDKVFELAEQYQEDEAIEDAPDRQPVVAG